MIVRNAKGDNYELGLDYIQKNYNFAEIAVAFLNLAWVKWKFKSINNIGFADAEPELFMNFDEFMKKYHIEPFANAFQPAWVGAGYGYYTEVPALNVIAKKQK